jgi:hypothetical protein
LTDLSEAVSRFGSVIASRFATGAGEPEDLLRGPFEGLLDDLAAIAGISPVVVAGEHHLTDERVRPDYAVHVAGALVGFAEIKAPGKGVDTARYRGHDKRQWERLSCLPNVLYTDGQSFALYRDGDRVGSVARLVGDVETSGARLTVDDDSLVTVVGEFLSWKPVSSRRPQELALTLARLCRLLRAEVEELLTTETALEALAEDWRRLLFPEADDSEFADGYAQTVTFALLLARTEGIEFVGRSLHDIAEGLGERHTLMGQALNVLTSSVVLREQAISVRTLQRVLSVVDWSRLSRGDPASWLYFYETFLEGYDPKLRRATGSYYTPVEAVDPMVRLVDDLLRTRLGHDQGFASPGVTVVDPGVGTGTFLFRVMDRIADAVSEQDGPGAVGPRLRQAAERLIGFELQAGPYSVAEVRLSTEFARLGAPLGRRALRVYLTDTLANPNEAEEHLPVIYAPIAESRTSANQVKREEPVMVVLGNPPYRERSYGDGGWIEQGDLRVPGRTSANANERAVRNAARRAALLARGSAPLAAFLPPRDWGVGAHVKHLYNPYVYFWRWATWKVFEGHPTDKGVVAFITVAGFLNGPGFARMRDYLRRTSDELWVIDCSPEGHQPEVATRIFQGVQQPVCITIALRDGSTNAETPAPVRYRSVTGRREDKFAALAEIEFDDGWVDCPSEWRAPFLPAGGANWLALPALDDLLAWSGSGTMPGRTWVIGPSPAILKERWRRLVSAPLDQKGNLLHEHSRDRRIDTTLSENLPGYPPVSGALASEHGACPEPLRYGNRSFDRQWIIPDKRVINQPNPSLWAVREARAQVFLTASHDRTPTGGPALTATSLVPDLHHYHGRGGRAWPLWLDAEGMIPNVVPGVLDLLGERLGRAVDGRAFFAYIAAVTASPAYTVRFARDLLTPGLRLPLTADRSLFEETVSVGERVLWLHTYGERFDDSPADRPSGPPRVDVARRPRVVTTIPDDEEGMPEAIDYEATTRELLIGAGRIGPVEASVWTYEVSGMKVLKHWFDRRKREPDGRRSSPLDAVVNTTWDPDWTSELLETLNVLTLLIDLEPTQAALLERIMSGPLITLDDLVRSGVTVVERPTPAAPGRASPQLFEIDT